MVSWRLPSRKIVPAVGVKIWVRFSVRIKVGQFSQLEGQFFSRDIVLEPLKISQNSQENTCARVSCYNKETLAKRLSCEFHDIFKNTIFREHLWWLLAKIMFHWEIPERQLISNTISEIHFFWILPKFISENIMFIHKFSRFKINH